jgi:putative hydrolase of the HAD superfamily
MDLTTRPVCIWFDLDDTLITTTKSLKAAIRTSKAFIETDYPDFTEHDIAYNSMEAWLTELGPGTAGFANLSKMSLHAFRSHIAHGTLARLGIERIDIVKLMESSALAEESAWSCYPGIHKLLEDLQDQGITLGVISNGPTALQHRKLSLSGLTRYFMHVLLDCEVGVSKPDSKIFEAAETLMPNCHHVMIGNDPDADINGAIRAKWTAFWFTPGWDSETKPTEVGYIPIQHHSEILGYLTKG